MSCQSREVRANVSSDLNQTWNNDLFGITLPTQIPPILKSNLINHENG